MTIKELINNEYNNGTYDLENDYVLYFERISYKNGDSELLVELHEYVMDSDKRMNEFIETLNTPYDFDTDLATITLADVRKYATHQI